MTWSWRTAKRWAERYAELGAGAMHDRSSRPHHSLARTPQPLVPKIVHLRCKQRLGPVQIGGRLGLPPSTVYAVLTRCRPRRLSFGGVRHAGATKRYQPVQQDGHRLGTWFR